MKIYTIPVGFLGTNCYAVTDDKNVVLVDPGSDAKKIIGFLEKEKLNLTMILLTHAHFDHIGAVDELVNRFSVPVYLHKNDFEMAKNPEYNSSMSFGGEVIKCTPDKFYSEGDEIPFGNESFKIIHTPGHTEGGVCLVFSNVIFTGDTVFKGSAGRTDLYKGNYFDLINSIQKLSALSGDYKLLPGHGEETTLEYERRTNPYFKTKDISYDDIL